MVVIFDFDVSHPIPAARVTLVIAAVRFAIVPDLNGANTFSGYLPEALRSVVIRIPAVLLAHVTTPPGEALEWINGM